MNFFVNDTDIIQTNLVFNNIELNTDLILDRIVVNNGLMLCVWRIIFDTIDNSRNNFYMEITMFNSDNNDFKYFINKTGNDNNFWSNISIDIKNINSHFIFILNTKTRINCFMSRQIINKQ